MRFRRRRYEQELDEELRYHIERQVEHNIARGMSPEEARRAAMLAIAGLEQRKEECRDAAGITVVDNVRRDIRYALRGLIKNPGFSCAVVLTLALGIGANAAVFTIVNSVLLRQLPFKNADHLVWIWSTRTDRDRAFYSIPNFIDTREQAQTLDDMAAFANWGVNLTGSGEAERLVGVRLTANAFGMLGVDAALGRLLAPADGAPDASRVVVISNALWRNRFGGDPRIVGQSILLGGTPYSVVGVLPKEFALPNAQVDVAAPLMFESDPLRTERGSNFLRTFAHLKAGIAPQEAQAELRAITERLKEQFPTDNAKHTAPRVLMLRDEVVGNYRALLWILVLAVGVVLLIACTNLASMLLVRSTARRKDFAIRAALGGSRRRIIGELMTSALLLTSIGGALGLFVASSGVQLLLTIAPSDLPRMTEVALDWHVLAFTVSLSVLAGIVFGLTPAIQINRLDVNHTLKAAGKTTEGVAGIRIRRALVALQVALSLLLLITAGLLIRSFVKLQAVSAGVDGKNVLSVQLSLPATKYAQPEIVDTLIDSLTQNIGRLPGVESVSVGSILPLTGANTRADFSIAGRPPVKEEDRPAAQNRWIAPGYFRTMGIPLIAGRDFTDLDNDKTQQVILIDEVLAARFLGNVNPIGMHLEVGDSGPEARDVEIIGVVGNVKHFSLDEPPTATYYSPLAQVPTQTLRFLINGMSLVARTKTDPLSLADRVRQEIRSLDNEVPASSVRSVEQLLATAVAPRRFNLVLIEIFAAAALVLAAMGLYSVIAYTVVQRRQEIGIRIALGASAGDVFKQVLREGMLLTVLGEAAGLAAALGTTRFFSGLLFGVTPTDPLTFGGISAMLTATAFVACYIPARRAVSVDPTVALKND